MTKLILHHQLGAGPWSGSIATERFPIFKTCLRQVAFGFASENEKFQVGDLDLRFEQEAYRFLLSIICGLESPVLGETEIMGQFKVFTDLHGKDCDPLFRNLLTSLWRDAKAIRHLYLSGLGCQSYGSWIRKQMKEGESLALIGKGELAREILPWLLKEELSVSSFTRNGNLTPGYGEHPHYDLSKTPVSSDVIILAAPISSKQFLSSLSEISLPRLVIDLRGESVDDSIHGEFRTVNLKQVMEELAKDRHVAHQRGQLAGAEVARAAENFHRQVKIRPLGWDDLCA